MTQNEMPKAALRGEPSYVWREGQQRRLEMIIKFAGERMHGKVFENGCGVGMYMQKMAEVGGNVTGLEYDFDRARDAKINSDKVINAAGEFLPLPSSTFDLILSHEVIEHVQNDRSAIAEMIRVLKVGGRAVIFCPNRGYPFETHGIFWNGKYYFGNKPFINYLPRAWRDKLAPHVKVYTKKDLGKLFYGLPVKFIERMIIFGAYDNIIARFGLFGKFLRAVLQFLESTPLKISFLGSGENIKTRKLTSEFLFYSSSLAVPGCSTRITSP
jgi:SAM-dependent methyltransferase